MRRNFSGRIEYCVNEDGKRQKPLLSTFDVSLVLRLQGPTLFLFYFLFFFLCPPDEHRTATTHLRNPAEWPHLVPRAVMSDAFLENKNPGQSEATVQSARNARPWGSGRVIGLVPCLYVLLSVQSRFKSSRVHLEDDFRAWYNCSQLKFGQHNFE